MFLNQDILVVDSDPHTLRIVKEALLGNGFIVHFAHNCELAMQLAIRNRPDMIVSEMALIDMDGLDFMRLVRKTPECSEVPFIFLTSRTLIRERISALEEGADDYITKPFNENELIARIKSILRRSDRPKISTLTREDGIKGNLKDINLLDLIQLFDMGRKTAVIQITGSGGEGRIYFQGGEVVHAVSGKQVGKDGLFEILSIHEGTFLIHLNIRSKIRTIELASTNLIMEAMHRFDEGKISPPPAWHDRDPLGRIQKSVHTEGIKELFEEGIIKEFQKNS